MPPVISDYYEAATQKLRQEVESTPDDQALGMDPDEWADYLVKKYGMEPIRVDDTRSPIMVETSTRFGRAVEVRIPVVPSDTLQVIAAQGLAGSPFSIAIDYKTRYVYDHHEGTLGVVVPQEVREVERARNEILGHIRNLNSAIENCNQTFPGKVRQIVASKQEAVKAKHRHLDNLSRSVGIELVKKTDISKVVPTAVKPRETIAPLIPPKPKIRERPVLSPDKFSAILELIENQCRQFERTPEVFQGMSEEALRDVLLSSLNAVFQGAAVGEAFQGLGKADIHLRIPEGEVFIAECKFWTGPAALTEVVGQLLERLTWREGYGVTILFSLNTDFGHVLETVQKTLPTLPRFVGGTIQRPEAHHFIGQFNLPSDETSQIQVHALVFNLYTPRRPGRTGGGNL